MIFSVTSSSCFAIITASFILALPSAAIHPACAELLGQGCRGNQGKSQNGNNSRINTNSTIPARVVISTQGEESQDELAANSSSTVILKRHLQSIQEYLDNPIHHLAQQRLNLDDEIDNDERESLPALVATLEDLKEQVRDSDKAQEFYSLGGWPLVATLVSNNVHFGVSDNNNKHDDEPVKKILAIRANAAWVMGAAVKNVAEFRSWVLEPIVGDDNSPTTALEIIVQALLEVSDAADFPGSCSQSTIKYQEELASRSVYAVESFLIGNAPAQIAFSSMSSNPARILGVQAMKWAHEAASTAASSTSSNAPMSRHVIKMTTHLLSLAMNIVQDNIIVESFSTTDEWCQAARQAAALTPATAFKRLVFRSLQSTAIKATATLEQYCLSMSLPLDIVDQD